MAESCSENLTIGSHFRELPSLTIEYWLPDSECSSKSQDIDSETYANYFFVLIGLLWNSQQDSELKERGSEGLNIKWSLYMSWNHPNLTYCKKWQQGSQNLTHYRTRPLPWMWSSAGFSFLNYPTLFCVFVLLLRKKRGGINLIFVIWGGVADDRQKTGSIKCKWIEIKTEKLFLPW